MQWLKTKTIEQALADSDEPGRQLQRSLGAFDLMILGVAVAVGVGIFSVGARAAGSFLTSLLVTAIRATLDGFPWAFNRA